MTTASFQPTGGITSAGLLSSTDDDQSDKARSSLVLSLEDAYRIYDLLKESTFETSTCDSYVSDDSSFEIKVKGLNHAGEFAATQHRLVNWFRAHLPTPTQEVSRVSTSIEVEGFHSLETFTQALKPTATLRFPKVVRFTLRRTLVTASLRETLDGQVLRIEVSKIAKLHYSLDHSMVRGHERFKLSYSSSMCFVTDSAAAKYERIGDPQLELQMLPLMFTQPLHELFRLSQSKPRPRQYNIPTPEILLSNFNPTAERGAAVFESIDWKTWWATTDMEDLLKFPFFDRIDLSSLSVAARLRLLFSNLESEELQIHLQRVLTFVHSIFTSRYYDKGGFAEITGRAKVVQDAYVQSSLTEEVLLEEVSGAQGHMNAVKLEVYDKAAELRKLYELTFIKFDVNKVERELRKTKDVTAFHDNVQLHSNVEGSDLALDATPASASASREDLVSSIDIHLLLTRRALSIDPEDPTSQCQYNRNTAAGLIRFIVDQGGMDNAFMHDFKLAFTRAGLNYWLSPEKWTTCLPSPAAFIEKARSLSSADLPSQYRLDPDSLDYTLRAAEYLMTCPEEKLYSEKVQGLQKLFPLESVVSSGKNSRKNRIRKVPELMILLFALMSRKKKMSLLDALEAAPFLSDAAKEEYRFKNWRFRASRKRTGFTEELTSLSLKHLYFNPRYCYGLHEVMLRNLFDIFVKKEDLPFQDVNSSNVSLTTAQQAQALQSHPHNLIPEFRRGLARIVSSQSAKVKTCRV